MEISKLEKATKILAKIKELDKEIIEIDKMAMVVANNDTDSEFTLSVIDYTKKKEDESKVEFDEDGSIKSINPHPQNLTFSFIRLWGESSNEKQKDDENKLSLTNKISTNNTLTILGYILSEKMGRRNKLLNQLNKLGVK